ncbi:TIGR01440 family protein [Paenibacillus glycinis]|uniref:TIGR01440 family protein n=1 Tax=Paenibacillus glycinis TaxID=2697035 RepID=UPI002E28FEEC|nr:TIGR01440 family protein [Paenibacillus glycinis]
MNDTAAGGNAAQLTRDVETVVRELAETGNLRKGQLLVIGVSTSEVLGQRIGTSGTLETARAIYEGIEAVRGELGFFPVFQCCEHLNRALVMEREAAERYGLELVSAVPVRKAGGSMAAYAFGALRDAVLTETVQAHAGIDIGDTFIGMHLKRVAVPVRPSIRSIGSAHVTMAVTRPKLIGGERAVYSRPSESDAESGNCD